MAFEGGTGTQLERIVSMENWIARTDPILYGPKGDDGLIREHQDEKAVEVEEKKRGERKQKNWTMIAALFGALPLVLRLLEAFHIIPK